MFPLPILQVTMIEVNLQSMDSRHAVPYHLAFMKNTILRALNNIYTLARELQYDDPRLEAFLQYISGTCDILVLHIHEDERLFRAPVIAEIALEKVLSDGCVQDMRKVIRGAEDLKSLAQQYKKSPCNYSGDEIIEYLSFGNEFAARSWAQIHSINVRRLEDAYSEAEMRLGLQEVIDAFVCQSDAAFLVPFIHSHHDRTMSTSWPSISPEGRMTVACLAKTYARSWELAPYDISTGKRRGSRETQIKMHLNSRHIYQHIDTR
ncbi:hypothetical protein BGW80DRAFT_1282818 [Lactifluus volemus]|nr:hypothetical protein BGW80DRAFT_1282818 [Lactifluus volemus]